MQKRIKHIEKVSCLCNQASHPESAFSSSDPVSIAAQRSVVVGLSSVNAI